MAHLFVETTLGRLEQGDALEWLASLPAGSVDLVVADPPYNLGNQDWDRRGVGEYLDWTRAWVGQASRALKPRGSLYVMGFSEILADIKVAVADGFDSCRWLVWYYRNKANLRDDWGRSHESILHLRKSGDFVFRTDEVRIPYNAHTVKYPERTQAETSQYGGARAERWRPNPRGARPRDVLEVPVLCNGTREKTQHPTQKPVQLVRKFVLASSAPGDLVVDPFAGSGTTALVCETTGRRWAACEQDARFVALAGERIRSPAEFAGSQTETDEADLARRRGALRAGRAPGEPKRGRPKGARAASRD